MLVAPIVLIVEAFGEPTADDEIGAAIVLTMMLVGARVWLLQRDSKKAATALAQSERRLSLAQQVAGVSVWDRDLASDRLSVSGPFSEMISGSTDADPTYEGWVGSIHPEDREQVLSTFAQAAKQGSDFEQVPVLPGRRGGLDSFSRAGFPERGRHSRPCRRRGPRHHGTPCNGMAAQAE